jgi:hypothetical protein
MQVTERIVAARDRQAGPERWAFSEHEVSGFFTFCLTDAWASRIQADYYQEFWDELLQALKGEDGPLEIELDIHYNIGKEDEDTIKQYMQRWVDLGSGFLAVRQSDNPSEETPQFVHMTLNGFKLKPLEVSVD